MVIGRYGNDEKEVTFEKRGGVYSQIRFAERAYSKSPY